MYFDKESPFYVETCFLLIFRNINAFYYNDNGLDSIACVAVIVSGVGGDDTRERA